MTEIKSYSYSETEVSFFLADTTSGEFLWVFFKSDGTNCTIQKVSAHNPLQVYFDVEVSVDEIKKASISGSYIYIAVDDATLIGQRYSLSNPLNTPTNFDLPAGITEAPVDIIIDTNVYFLIPGDLSGTNAKILEFTTSGTYIQEIDLTGVNNATSFEMDENDEIRVITYTSPVQFVRVYDLDTTPQFSTTNITD